MHTSHQDSKRLISEYKVKLRDSLPDDIPKEVKHFLDFTIEHLFDESLTITEAKNACNIKNKNFTSRFSYHVGTNPKHFILKHRIKASKLLLAELKASIAHVSILVGFSTLSAFSKAFKSNSGGINPSEWKAQNSGENSRKSSS